MRRGNVNAYMRKMFSTETNDADISGTCHTILRAQSRQTFYRFYFSTVYEICVPEAAGWVLSFTPMWNTPQPVPFHSS